MPQDNHQDNDRPADLRDELALPDDLAVLGEELRASAAHLASMYPAPSFNAGRVIANVEPVRRAAAPRWRAYAIAAGGLACAVVALLASRPFFSGGASQTNSPAQVAAVAPEVNHKQGELPAAPVAHPATELGGAQQAVEIIPAAAFHDLSAPELEGMLDLLEQQPGGARVSI